MIYETLETAKGTVSTLKFEDGESIQNFSDFFDAIMGAPTDTLIVEKGYITETFFDLSSGLAGDVLQKVSNYRKRLAIIGDFSSLTSTSLRDFIYESNRTGKVIFDSDAERAVKLLR